MSDPEAPTPPRLPKPESLEAKFALMRLLPYNRKAKRKHCLVFGFILDWFHSKYGNALASVQHVVTTIKERDPAGKGLYAGDVHGALTDLVAWGYLKLVPGSGRRAHRYVPNWSLVCSVRENPNTTQDEHSVRETPNTGVRETPNTTTDSVRDSTNEDPSTVTRLQDRVNGIDGQDCAAPTAPPVAGLAAATAGTAQDGFEQLWQAYDYKKKKKEARAAYAKLAPDAELLSTMAEAARAWQASWAAQNKPDAPRFHLHKWIEREEYECEPPTGYKPKKAKESAKAKPREPAGNAPFSERRELLTVVGSSVVQDDTELTLYLDVVDEAGEETDMSIFLQSYDEKTQEEGQLIFARLLTAAGLSGCEDSSELHGARFIRVLRSKFGAYDYEPAPANDNAPPAEATA